MRFPINHSSDSIVDQDPCRRSNPVAESLSDSLFPDKSFLSTKNIGAFTEGANAKTRFSLSNSSFYSQLSTIYVWQRALIYNFLIT